MRSLLIRVALAAVPLWAQNAGPPPAPVPAPSSSVSPPVQAAPTLDKGHLDPAWFNLAPGAFTAHDLADFGWVKPGFKLAGRSIKVLWDPPHWTEPNTDEGNLKAAEAHATNFPTYLRESLTTLGGIPAAADAGDLVLVGRLVECNTKGGFLSMAIESITYDLKLVDPATGETLVALHHRLLGGPGWKGNGSRRRFLNWSESLAKHAKANWLP